MTEIRINFPIGEMLMVGRFYRSIIRDRRFFLPPVEQEFADHLLRFAKRHRSLAISRRTRLFRARINPSQALAAATRLKPRELRPPLAEQVSAGRLNPAGISYFYVAEDEKTALAEVRPWKGAAVTLGRVKLNRELKVVDIVRDAPIAEPYETDADHRTDVVWRELVSYLFSVPYQPEDSVSYAPTQYLAEAMRVDGFDGVRYDSAMNPGGRNLVIFDPSLAEVTSTRLAQVENVDYEYRIARRR